jgi:hypothetical protein
MTIVDRRRTHPVTGINAPLLPPPAPPARTPSQRELVARSLLACADRPKRHSR